LASDYPPVAVGRLREVAARLAELRYGGGEAGRWLLNLVAEYSSGARLGLRLDEATGLIPKPGHSPWWVIEDREHRDELLRESAESWIGSPCTRPAARWSRDRPFKSPPDESHEKLDELMFGLLKCGPAPAQRAVERALGDCRQVARWYHARTCRPGTQAPHRALALCHDWRDIGGRHLASGGLNGPRQSISLPIRRSRWHSGQAAD